MSEPDRHRNAPGRSATPPPHPDSPWLDRHEAAAYLRISPNSVDNLVKRKVLQRWRIESISNHALYHVADLNKIVVEAAYGDLKNRLTSVAAHDATPAAETEASTPPGSRCPTDTEEARGDVTA